MDDKGNQFESTTAFYNTPNDPARHGKLVKRHVVYDGAWVVYGDHRDGRGAYKIEPWKDSAMMEDPNRGKTIYYDVRYHPENGDQGADQLSHLCVKQRKKAVEI